MITNKDLLSKLKAQELLELSDLNGTGLINQIVIDNAISYSLSFIESFIIIPTEPTTLLKNIAIELVIYELKRINELLNDSFEDRFKKNESYLIKMNKGLLPIEKLKTEEHIIQKNYHFEHNNNKIDTNGFKL